MADDGPAGPSPGVLGVLAHETSGARVRAVLGEVLGAVHEADFWCGACSAVCGVLWLCSAVLCVYCACVHDLFLVLCFS